jgi:hypothetical protein
VRRIIFFAALCGIAVILSCDNSTTPPDVIDNNDITVGETRAVHLSTENVLGGIVEIWARNSSWNPRLRLLTVDIYLVNRSEKEINAPVFLVIRSLNPSTVDFVNPDGQTEESLPFKEFDNEFGTDGQLTPDETSESVGFVFDVQEHESFSIEIGLIDIVSPNGVISGIVFRDANQNEIHDDAEGGLEGISVTARYVKNNDEVDTLGTQTDPTGNYSFSGLEAGVYTLNVEVPPGASATTGVQLLVDLIQLIDGTVPAFRSADFGIYTEPRASNALPVLISEWEADVTSMAIDRTGHLRLTNPFSGSVFEYLPTGELIDTWYPSIDAIVLWPMYMEFRNRHFYFISGMPKPSRIVVFEESHEFSQYWLEKYHHGGFAGGIDGITVDNDGFVYTLEFDGEVVVKYAPDGVFECEWSTHGVDPGTKNWPGGIVVGPNGIVYVSDTLNHRILMFTRDGEFFGQFGVEGGNNGEFRWPVGLAIDEDQILYVADRLNSRIQKFTLSGSYLAQFATGNYAKTPLVIAIKGRDIYVLLDNDVIQYFRYSQ